MYFFRRILLTLTTLLTLQKCTYFRRILLTLPIPLTLQKIYLLPLNTPPSHFTEIHPLLQNTLHLTLPKSTYFRIIPLQLPPNFYRKYLLLQILLTLPLTLQKKYLCTFFAEYSSPSPPFSPYKNIPTSTEYSSPSLSPY